MDSNLSPLNQHMITLDSELLSLQGDCNVIDLRGIFDDVSGPIYWDQGHISDTGNLILAEKFHEYC